MATTGSDLNLVLDAPVLGPPTAVAGAYAAAVQLVREADCRAVRFRPGRGGYPLVDWVLSPLPELCAREDVAVVLEFEPAPIAWDDVVRFARAFPTVPMVVAGVSLARDSAAPAALDVAANLVLQVVAPDGDDAGLARLLELFGPHRFIVSDGDETASALARGEWRSLHL
jgi:hypothetical protein